MKKHLLFFISIVFWLQACKEKPEDPYVNDIAVWGEASATKNGLPWTATCGAASAVSYPGKFIFGINRFNANNHLRDQLGFRYVPFQEGIYYPLDYPTVYGALPDSAMTVDFGTILSDGDVAGDRYVMLHDSAVVLYIDKIDPQTKEFWGRFSATMIKYIEHQEWDPNSPDTLKFENGRYHAKITR